MKRNVFLLFFTIISMFFSCGLKGEKNSEAAVAKITVKNSMIAAPALVKKDEEVKDNESTNADILEPEKLADNPTINNKKIIKDGTMSVKTNDINDSKNNLDNLLKQLNAYYDNEELHNDDEKISYDLKIRVPADNFEKLISSIENGNDEVKSKSIQARDVTEEFVDIEARLANKREYLNRYKELLTKSSTVKDILDIQENIRVIQEEIESKEGRLKYLNNQVAFSTLDFNLYKDKAYTYKPQAQDKFSERVKTSLSDGWASIVGFVLWVITNWPYILISIVVLYFIRRFIRMRNSKKR